MDLPTSSATAQLVAGCNQFAVNLYAKLAEDNEDNLFFSPSSISLALGMTLVGADGETARELAALFGNELPPAEIHAAFQKLQSNTQTGGIELKIANRLWGQRGYHFLPEFLDTTRKFYGAELGEVDFAKAAEVARLQINGWIADQTADKIQDLIPEGLLHPNSLLVLTNAIYFLGGWKEEFEEELTQTKVFHAPGGDCPADMMHQTGYFPYAETETCQILEMPYRRTKIDFDLPGDGPHLIDASTPTREFPGSHLSMRVVLPRGVDGLGQVDVAELLGCSLRPQLVEIEFPKFKFESEFLLGETLPTLGVQTAFSPAADFSKISDDPAGLMINEVIHKAIVDVSEKGTEAAAATGVLMAAGCAAIEPPEPIPFHADRPFLFCIRDEQTGQIHFLGRMVSPRDAD